MSSTPLKNDSLPDWLASPAGQYLCAWEQIYLDRAVADVFGFDALQLGFPALDALQVDLQLAANNPEQVEAKLKSMHTQLAT